MVKAFLLAALMISGSCATAFATATPSYSEWFKGKGSGSSATAWTPENATLDMSSAGSSCKVEDSQLKLDLLSNEQVTLTPTGSAAPDENTVTAVEITTTLYFVSALPAVTEAKTALVVHEGKYKAWDGSAWQVLGDCTLSEGASVALKVELSYQDMAESSPVRTATFYVGGSKIGNTITLASNTATKLDRVECNGGAEITQISGNVMLGVAKANNKKFGTVDAAEVEAAGASDKIVTLLRDSDQEVAAKGNSGVEINYGDKKTGSVTIPSGESYKIVYQPGQGVPSSDSAVTIKTGTVTGGTPSVRIGDASKEAYETAASSGNVTFKIQTAKSIVAALNPGNDIKDGGLDVATAAKEAAVRALLKTHAATHYNGMNTQVADLNADLRVAAANGFPFWKNYVLGIADDQVLKPVVAANGDKLPSAIALSVDGIDTSKYSGDYDVEFKAMSGDVVKGTGTKNANEIQVPLATGTYDVQVVLTPKN